MAEENTKRKKNRNTETYTLQVSHNFCLGEQVSSTAMAVSIAIHFSHHFYRSVYHFSRRVPTFLRLLSSLRCKSKCWSHFIFDDDRDTNALQIIIKPRKFDDLICISFKLIHRQSIRRDSQWHWCCRHMHTFMWITSTTIFCVNARCARCWANEFLKKKCQSECIRRIISLEFFRLFGIAFVRSLREIVRIDQWSFTVPFLFLAAAVVAVPFARLSRS